MKAAAQALVPPEPGREEDTARSETAQGDEKTTEESGEKDAAQRRPSLASLKLLRALQNTLNEETEALEAKGKDQQGVEMLRLADEQQALAEQTQKLMQDILKSKQ